MNASVRVFDDAGALMTAAAALVVERLGAVAGRPRLALAGGSTPRALYARLAAEPFRSRVDWSRVLFAFGDERMVPPDHPDSNHRMARETLLDPLGVEAASVLRIPGERPPEHAAEVADASLRAWAERTPLFDLVLLGLGEDGHTASLFPAERWPDFGARLAAVTRHPDGAARVTLTPHALASTAATVFLVSGGGKAEAVRATFAAADDTPRHPARMVAGRIAPAVWMLDAAAAAGLPGGDRA